MVDEADRARRGVGRCLLIEGEAGVGKSRLVADVLSRSAAFDVFQASAREIERERPFGAVFEALGVRHSSEDPQRAEIARLLRTSAGAGPGLRFRIADDLVELVERLSLARPVAIALDDLHWADDGSILAFHGLLSRIASLPILLVGAYRPYPRPAGLDDIEKLVADGRGRVVRLGPLEDDDVFDIASHLLDGEPGPRLRERLSGVAGNPFFATELIAALDEDGAITTAGGRAEVAGTSIPPELRMVDPASSRESLSRDAEGAAYGGRARLDVRRARAGRRHGRAPHGGRRRTGSPGVLSRSLTKAMRRPFCEMKGVCSWAAEFKPGSGRRRRSTRSYK